MGFNIPSELREPTPEASVGERSQLAWLIAMCSGGIVLLTRDLYWIAAIGLCGALGAGFVRGKAARARSLFTLVFVAVSAGVAAATSWYVSGRQSVWKLELLIPFGIGVIPGGIFYLALLRSSLLPSSERGDQS